MNQAIKVSGNKGILVYPNQLFPSSHILSKECLIFLIEDQLYFGDYKYFLRFHKQKLMFHRSSMKAYADQLTQEGYRVVYIDYQKSIYQENIVKTIEKYNISELYHYEPYDDILGKRIEKLSKTLSIKLVEVKNHGFLFDTAFFKRFYEGKKHYSFTSVYIELRKKANILTSKNKPVGGRWTFDVDNRLKIPAGTVIPQLPRVSDSKYVTEAREYVQLYFNENPGECYQLNYPITHEACINWLENFLESRFNLFGSYEDAMMEKETFLFHSVLSFALNSGLMTPDFLIEKVVSYGLDQGIPLNSFEGFIRQVLGWREFMGGMYSLIGVQQRNSNYFDHQHTIPGSFYNGTTGILPVDTVINRLITSAYSHHIERLMVLGNFMLLCEISPQEVYKWFMEMYIDAYDWVMVPNVYGMSQYADGGMMVTKPYVSSSNYIRKMSDFPSGEWCDIFNALYWRFIAKHYEKFVQNPRMSLVARQAAKLDTEKLKNHQILADKYLDSLHGS